MASNEKNKNRPKENDTDSDNDEEQLPPNQLSLVNCQISSVEAVVKDISDNMRLSQELFGSSTPIRKTPQRVTTKKNRPGTGGGGVQVPTHRPRIPAARKQNIFNAESGRQQRPRQVAIDDDDDDDNSNNDNTISCQCHEPQSQQSTSRLFQL